MATWARTGRLVGMWWWNAQGWWSFGSQVLAAITTVAILALAATALILLVREFRTKRGPEATLAERFARGEIEEHEYRRQLRILRDEGADEPTRATS